MSRSAAIAAARRYFDEGGFVRDLARQVAFRTASDGEGEVGALHDYLAREMLPQATALGFEAEIVANPVADAGPYLIGQRMEDPRLPTVLVYGHGDVVQGQEDRWRPGLSPWSLTAEGDRLYGRGTADNKGQLTVNLGALRSVLAARKGRLGFNVKLLVEMAEEQGSPDMEAFCVAHRDALAADVLLASDGPRLSAATPTLFLGSRGIMAIELSLDLRAGAHHSGNWGGLLRNPATVLAAAIHSLVDLRGAIRTPLLRPAPIPESVREALALLTVGGAPGDPLLDVDWGEPGLTPAERVFGWNTLEVLALECGNAGRPVSAIPPVARACCELRYVEGTDLDNIEERLAAHFAASGMPMVRVKVQPGSLATRLDPEHPWVRWAARSVQASVGSAPAILPNLGGTIPNEVFTRGLGLPTVWVPHSYPACSQHAPNEHLLGSVARQGLEIMAGLYWDLGDPDSGVPGKTHRA